MQIYKLDSDRERERAEKFAKKENGRWQKCESNGQRTSDLQ